MSASDLYENETAKRLMEDSDQVLIIDDDQSLNEYKKYQFNTDIFVIEEIFKAISFDDIAKYSTKPKCYYLCLIDNEVQHVIKEIHYSYQEQSQFNILCFFRDEKDDTINFNNPYSSFSKIIITTSNQRKKVTTEDIRNYLNNKYDDLNDHTFGLFAHNPMLLEYKNCLCITRQKSKKDAEEYFNNNYIEIKDDRYINSENEIHILGNNTLHKINNMLKLKYDELDKTIKNIETILNDK